MDTELQMMMLEAEQEALAQRNNEILRVYKLTEDKDFICGTFGCEEHELDGILSNDE
ncbi:MAG: hypothetical protein R3Y53_08425 [Bacillota bacterium]